jgi:uncharacterized membrane protein YccC
MRSRPTWLTPRPSSRDPTAIGAALRDAARFDRSAVSPAGGLIAAIPLTAIFGIAVAAGEPVAAATMGAGAMLVGVAWRVAGGRPPVALLTVDAVLMSFSTFLGSATGSLLWLHLLVVFAWSLTVGLLVALGRRGAVVSTQAVIGIVVFGRFAEPVGAALGLAGLVLAGGLAMVLFVAIVRWPSPLKLQRRAVADAYRALADLALAPRGASTIPAATGLDEARAALSSPTLFGDPAVLALRGLIDEASRFRIELRAITVLLEQAIAGRMARGAPTDAPNQEQATRKLLEASASALRTVASAIEGERGASSKLGAISSQEIAARSEPAPTDTKGQPTELHLARRLEALGGQLRAMARLADTARQHGSLLERRPRMGTARPTEGLHADLALLRANATLQSPAGRHAVRLAVVVLITEILSRHVPLQRSYWMVVAAATVLRPEFAATFTRGAERILGTCAGVGLAGLIVVGLHPSLGVVAPIIGVLAWIAYAVFPASFAVGFAFLTALVVFLLDAVTTDTLATAGDRLLNTLVGGAIGLLAYALWPTWSHKPARQALAEVVHDQREYLAAIAGAIVAGRQATAAETAPLARRARLAYTTAGETVARSLTEPAARRIDAEQSQGILAAERRLVSVIHVLRTLVHDEGEHEPVPALAPFERDVDRALELVEGALRDGQRFAPTNSPDRPLAVPDLRDSYARVSSEGAFDGDRRLLLHELDELVDAVNSLAALVAGR